METKTEIQGDFRILSITGMLDASNAHQFEQNFFSLCSEGVKGIIIDMKGLEYMSSAGIREIIKAKRLLDSGNISLSFCSLQPFLTEVFDMAGLLDRLQIYPDRERAIAAHS